VADSGWSNVRIFNAKGNMLLFFGGRGDYLGLLRNPTALAIDKQNPMYVADFVTRPVAIFRAGPAGTLCAFHPLRRARRCRLARLALPTVRIR
jgi:hypothetical protein